VEDDVRWQGMKTETMSGGKGQREKIGTNINHKIFLSN